MAKNTRPRRYAYNFSCTGSEPPDHPTSGALRTAVALAKRTGCKIKLSNSAGWQAGYVNPDGTYRLT
jgi:hypothetical protein